MQNPANPFKRKTRLNFFFGILLIILLGTNLFSYRQVDKVVNANTWVQHTNQVMRYLDNILIDLVQVESATRGYLFSKDPAFVNRIDDEIADIFSNFKVIKELIKNPEQQLRLEKLEPILTKRINDLKEQIILRDTKALDLKSMLPFINKSKELTVQIEDIVINIINIFFLVVIMVIINRMLSELIASKNKIEKSESLIKCIIENSKEYIGAIDNNYKFLAFNESFAKEFRTIFGKRIAVGDSIRDALAHLPEEREKVLILWRRALNGEEFTVTEEFGTGLELKRQYEITCNALYDEHNKLFGAAVIARNVEKRFEIERNLKKTNEELASSLQEVKKKAYEMNIVNEMYNKLRSSDMIEEILEMIVLYFKKLFPGMAGAIYLMSNSKNYLEHLTEWGEPRFIEKVMSPEQCWGLREGKIFLYVSKNENVLCKHFIKSEEKICSYICVPLLAFNEVIGVLHLQLLFLADAEEKDIIEFYNRNHMTIQNLASQISLSISNIRLSEILKKRSTRDALTGLYNRVYLEEFFEKDLQRAKRKKTSVAVVMMDLDHFKNVNDLYGHESGDVVLKKISNLITLELRNSDVACRYGGEEIIIILYDITVKDALEKINELKVSISELEFHFADLVRITASFGIAMFPEHGEDVQQLTKAADEALYLSKKLGRNRIMLYHS